MSRAVGTGPRQTLDPDPKIVGVVYLKMYFSRNTNLTI
jgi:hypothetical protein